ncbi:hypothetical protein IC762_18845 [Bradyrhizobium genosp. L]|uniref:hypothetical protein n=1 Tax=Bradyrhizobium genosp. L TaxID=83637 RepID=UPI0018A2E859|nr:hypothetical protein [Bradyrhizobium genosp. L]QPF81862.1 hypothetical protein IC762_18845 [Bradyrhizobium genosp. L]
MTAAARACQQEKLREQNARIRADRIKEDLAALERLRTYIVRQRRVIVPSDALLAAIDDYVEQLTGDRTALHMKGHSIGVG